MSFPGCSKWQRFIVISQTCNKNLYNYYEVNYSATFTATKKENLLHLIESGHDFNKCTSSQFQHNVTQLKNHAIHKNIILSIARILFAEMKSE